MERWVLRTRKGRETRGSTEALQKRVRKKGPWAGTQLATPAGEPVGSIFFAPWLRPALMDWRVDRLRAGLYTDGVLLAGCTTLFLSAGDPRSGLGFEHKFWIVLAALIVVSLGQNAFELFRNTRLRAGSPAKFYRGLIHELRFWYHARWKSASALAAASALLIAVPEFGFWWLTGETGETQELLQLKGCSAALDKPAVLKGGQWWRLSTMALVHLNGPHLVTTAIGLFGVLALLVRVWGAVIGFTVLLVGIYGGALLSLTMTDAPSVGISAGILSMVAFGVARGVREARSLVPPAIVSGLAVAILELAALSIWVFADYFDHFAHLGGLLAGTFVALLWRPEARIWLPSLVALAAFFVASAGIAVHVLMTACL